MRAKADLLRKLIQSTLEDSIRKYKMQPNTLLI